MSSWAEIDANNLVIRVLVGDNNDPAGDEGYSWLINNLGGTWIQTSYNNRIRGIYAGIGFTYNEAEDIFITPQPYPSWIREGSFWTAPVAYPTDGKKYAWDEEDQAWILVDGQGI
jgi:hypothetical protein